MANELVATAKEKQVWLREHRKVLRLVEARMLATKDPNELPWLYRCRRQLKRAKRLVDWLPRSFILAHTLVSINDNPVFSQAFSMTSVVCMEDENGERYHLNLLPEAPTLYEYL
jgi:hypothetical protein